MSPCYYEPDSESCCCRPVASEGSVLCSSTMLSLIPRRKSSTRFWSWLSLACQHYPVLHFFVQTTPLLFPPKLQSSTLHTITQKMKWQCRTHSPLETTLEGHTKDSYTIYSDAPTFHINLNSASQLLYSMGHCMHFWDQRPPRAAEN